MSQILTLEKPQQLKKFSHPFLQELIRQIRLRDTCGKYHDWSDELLLQSLISWHSTNYGSSENHNLEPLNQLLISAFYHTIAAAIEQKTGHSTQTSVHLKSKDFSSAVIFCGGVLVVYSLIWGYNLFGFSSLENLVKEAEKIIENALHKASPYLDFAS